MLGRGRYGSCFKAYLTASASSVGTNADTDDSSSPAPPAATGCAASSSEEASVVALSRLLVTSGTNSSLSSSLWTSTESCAAPVLSVSSSSARCAVGSESSARSTSASPGNVVVSQPAVTRAAQVRALSRVQSDKANCRPTAAAASSRQSHRDELRARVPCAVKVLDLNPQSVREAQVKKRGGKSYRGDHSERADGVAHFFRPPPKQLSCSLPVHENLCTVVSYEERPDSREIVLVMEALPGRTLVSWLERFGAMHEREVRHVARGLVAAVLQLHSHGVAHRDIKCDNVLYDRPPEGSGMVKLVDFGLSTKFALPSEGENEFHIGIAKRPNSDGLVTDCPGAPVECRRAGGSKGAKTVGWRGQNKENSLLHCS